MIYGSVCSGIEAASIAWEPLGWKPAWFCEIKPFCCEVLNTRWPDIENLKDLTELRQNNKFKNEKIDLLVGGTPCQAFSLAGDRKGLEDSRGDLTLEYIKCIEEKRPEWFIWENVPGVMSLNGGRDFGAILGEMVKLRYGVAYTVLDAKDFGLPQSRPRVFVVGHSSGDGRIPERVLCLQSTRHDDASRGDNAPGRIPTLTLRNAGAKNARGIGIIELVSPTRGTAGQSTENRLQIRSCTPREEERRQGFSGSHTELRGALDSDRYEAIGNSMAVPVMRWIGERIQFVDNLIKKETFMEDDIDNNDVVSRRTRVVPFKTCLKCGGSYQVDTGGRHKTGICVNTPTTRPVIHEEVVQPVKEQTVLYSELNKERDRLTARLKAIETLLGQ